MRGIGGLTLIELLIGLLLSAIVGGAALHFYKTQHAMYRSQTDTADRQGNLRAALDELSRQVRRAGYMVPGTDYLRVSSAYDTLTVFVGSAAGTSVDTVRYFVSRATATKPILARKVNHATADVFAESIDTALFVPASTAPIRSVAISLTSTPQSQFTNTSLQTRRRLGANVHLRNR